MAKLVQILKKKDYLLKTLPLPASENGRGETGLSRKDLHDYVRIHLPGLYPAPVPEHALGTAVFGSRVLVFIRTGGNSTGSRGKKSGNDRTERTARYIVPMLLHPLFTGKKTTTSRTLVFDYEDGMERVRILDDGALSVEWIPGTRPRRAFLSDPEKEKEDEEVEYIDLRAGDGRPVFPPPLKRTGPSSGDPFCTGEGPGAFRITRFALYTVCILITCVWALGIRNEQAQKERAALEREIRELSAVAMSLTEDEKISRDLRERVRELSAVQVFSPYAMLERIYGASALPRRQAGIRMEMTGFRLNRHEFIMEGYTNSAIGLKNAFDAYRQSGRFTGLSVNAMAAPRDGSDESSRRLGGFTLSGTWTQESSDEMTRETN